MTREVTLTRKTSETQITITLNVDGCGKSNINTPTPFLNHMLDALARHGFFDITIKATGDTEIDDHHTVEDIGIVLGQAFDEALGDKKGITRFGNFSLPMDEALIMSAVDFSGRGTCICELGPLAARVGSFDTELVKEFMIAFASNAKISLHLHKVCGENTHHIIEAAFKSLAKSLDQATRFDDRVQGVPSTKGTL